ncbi:MAG: hypothetical protein IKA61_05125 [Clostridia bacterium]|nr:hypothetical protein [Clostridia bacterium]
MKDFNSFQGSQGSRDEKLNFNGSPYEMFASLSKKYEGKSSDELMQAILKQAEQGRKNGTLTDSDIDNFVSTVTPLLNDKQKKTLAAVVNRLKKIK